VSDAAQEAIIGPWVGASALAVTGRYVFIAMDSSA